MGFFNVQVKSNHDVSSTLHLGALKAVAAWKYADAEDMSIVPISFLHLRPNLHFRARIGKDRLKMSVGLRATSNLRFCYFVVQKRDRQIWK